MKTVDEALAFAERVYSRVSDAGIIAAEVRRLRKQMTNDGIQIELLEHKLESLREENERLRKDAERGCYFIERGEWFRHDHGTPDAHALLAIRLPYTADLSCKAMREFAIDAARGAK